MEIITAIFFNVFLTSVMGSCGLILWFVTYPILTRRGMEMVYIFLKLVLVLYLFPVLFVIQFWRYNNSGEESMYGIVMLANQMLEHAFAAGAVIWIIGICILVLKRMKGFFKLRQIRKGDIPVEQEEAEKYFERICRELNIEGKVKLYCNDLCIWPCITGFLRPAILLPYREYSIKELIMIFYHELTHYLNRELGFKYLCEFIRIVHWFNPFTYCLLSLYDEWSETYCDMMTCRRGEKYFTKREYFLMLLDHTDKEEEQPEVFSSFLFGDGATLERRANRVLKYKRKQPLSRLAISLFMIVFMVGSSVPAFAMGNEMMAAYEGVYIATAERSRSAIEVGNELQEHVWTDGWYQLEDSAEIGSWVNPNARAIKQINWEVASGRLKRTYGFEASAGGRITILIGVDPVGDTIEMGIIDPDGAMRYVEGDGSTDFYYQFVLTKTGTYYFYVRNLSDNDIVVEGSVSY